MFLWKHNQTLYLIDHRGLQNGGRKCRRAIITIFHDHLIPDFTMMIWTKKSPDKQIIDSGSLSFLGET